MTEGGVSFGDVKRDRGVGMSFKDGERESMGVHFLEN
ncbi:hypothetical protein BVRB_7g164220 [Beta vulgaris subsp. vulgaris]|nr:hypothetical protein BVRB_7g164220 [Beta vulgaris subsp. vulgaris]